MIPEAAVEAMSKAYRDGVGVVPNDAWVRTLLEAAAPHMRAGAFDEGVHAGMVGWNNYKETDEITNPYRSQA